MNNQNNAELELLPCPFCLGEAEVAYIDNDESCLQGFYPRCSKCSINDDCLFSDKESAIKAWNLRTPFPYQSIAEEMAEALKQCLKAIKYEHIDEYAGSNGQYHWKQCHHDGKQALTKFNQLKEKK